MVEFGMVAKLSQLVVGLSQVGLSLSGSMKGDDSVFLSKPKQTYTLKLIVWGRLLFKLRVNLIKQKLLKLVVSRRLVPSLELEKAWGRLLNLRDKPKQTIFFWH